MNTKRYCEKCGKQLVVKTQHTGYDKDNGRKLYRVVLTCPNSSLFRLGHTTETERNVDELSLNEEEPNWRK
jgi:hypothetical protein